MGANTIRLWGKCEDFAIALNFTLICTGWSEEIDHVPFLDLAYNDGVDRIYVIVPFAPG